MSARSAHAQFRRALDRGNLPSALAAARDLPAVSLADALALCLLMAAKDRRLYSHAAARWLARWCLEVERTTLADAVLVAGALAGLAGPDPRPAAASLAALARRKGLPEVARVVDR